MNPITWIEEIVAPLEPAPRDSETSVVSKLKLMLALVVIGYLAACIYTSWQGIYLGKPYPYNTFLYQPWDRFMDYHNMVGMCQNLDPYNEGTRSGYPPFANIFFYPFGRLSPDAGFFIFALIPIFTLVVTSWLLLRPAPLFFRGSATLLVFLLSYPFLFALERGNLDLWIFIGVSFFLLNYNSRSLLRRDTACASLAFAICFKMYPVTLLMLFAKDRRYVECVKVALLVAIITIASASFFEGGTLKAYHDFRTMMSVTDSFAKGSVKNAHFNIGMFGAVVVVLTKLNRTAALSVFIKHYWVMSALLLLPYVLLLARREFRFWEAAMALMVICCLFPTLSYEYRVILLLPTIMMQITQRDRSFVYGRTVLVTTTLLLIPKNYWHLFPEVAPGDVSIASVIDPLLLFVLLNLIVFHRSAPSDHLRDIDCNEPEPQSGD